MFRRLLAPVLAAALALAPTIARPGAYPSPTYGTVTLQTGVVLPDGTSITCSGVGSSCVALGPALAAEASTARAAEQANAAAVSAETSRAQGVEGANAFAIGNEVARAKGIEATLAPIASPVLTGTPTAPTAAAGTSTGQLATTAFDTAAVAAESGRAQAAEGTNATAISTEVTTARNASNLSNGTIPAARLPGYSGDVAVPTGSAATTIQPGVVTNAKLATAPAGTLKANTGASIASPSDVTPSALLDTFATTQGSILYRGLTGWTALPPGSSGQVLGSSGTGANPAWQNAGGNGTVTSVGTGAGLMGGPITSSGTIAVQYVGSQPVNLGLAATVSGNALTVNLTGNNGSAPSSTNIVQLPFRDPTAAMGDWKWLTLTSSLSITAPTGATLGSASGKPFRLWVVALYNGGSPLLGLVDCSDGSSTIYPLYEDALVSAAAIGASSTSPGTIYSAVAVTSSPMVILGYLEYGAGLTTAGSFATAPPTMRLFSAGMRRPGEPVTQVMISTSTPANNNTSSYAGSNVSASITPRSPCNAIEVSLAGGTLYVPSTNVSGSIRTTRGSTGNTLSESALYYYVNVASANNGIIAPVSLDSFDFPATTAATTYAVQVKASDNASSVVFPHDGRATLKLVEIQG